MQQLLWSISSSIRFSIENVGYSPVSHLLIHAVEVSNDFDNSIRFWLVTLKLFTYWPLASWFRVCMNLYFGLSAYLQIGSSSNFDFSGPKINKPFELFNCGCWVALMIHDRIPLSAGVHLNLQEFFLNYLPNSLPPTFGRFSIQQTHDARFYDFH